MEQADDNQPDVFALVDASVRPAVVKEHWCDYAYTASANIYTGILHYAVLEYILHVHDDYTVVSIATERPRLYYTFTGDA